jgi:hypothetical protein
MPNVQWFRRNRRLEVITSTKESRMAEKFCDQCGEASSSVESYIFSTEPAKNLCKYCSKDFTHGDPIAKTLAAMFHELERSLIKEIRQNYTRNSPFKW